jgi:hypothetical protein
MLFGVAEGLPDDLLVPQMRAVKEPDGQADLAARGLQFLRVMDDSHQSNIRCTVARITLAVSMQ